MSTTELSDIQQRVSQYCAGDRITRSEVRTYREATLPPPADGRIFVDPDPSRGDDVSGDGSSARPFRTLTYALCRVLALRAEPSRPPQTWEINLAADSDFYGGANASDDPRSSDRRGEAWARDGDRSVRYDENSVTLFVDQLAGTDAHPIIIKAADRAPGLDYFDEFGKPVSPDPRPRLHFRLNLRSVQHIYLKNIRIIISGRDPMPVPGATPPLERALRPRRHENDGSLDLEGGNIVWVLDNVSPLQLSKIPVNELAGRLDTHHILLRGCEIDGGWRRRETPRALVSEEVLKVNQCQHIYVERCQIHGAFGGGKNSVDFVAVQFGHIVDSDIYDSANNWCVYVKGGSAYLRIEGNRIHGGFQGFSAGEGVTCPFMVSPWWHYEAYAIQFVNNLVYDIFGNTGVGVQGGYGILIAHNTLYNAGTGSGNGQMISLGFGQRNCIGADSAGRPLTPACAEQIRQGAWATTVSDYVDMIPSRHVYVYNNILLADDATAGFNIFNIARRPASPPPPPGTPSDFPPSPPAPFAADEGLDVRGNFLGVAGLTGTPGFMTWFESSFVSDSTDPRSGSFRSNFLTNNRTDVMPQLDTNVSDRNNFLRPTDSRSTVLESDVAISRVASPPATLSDWTANLRPLFATASAAPPAPWDTLHNVPVDFDKTCRRRIIPGARTRWNEFYVRDWTENRDYRDMGDEPSTRPDFWTTSDVWNQITRPSSMDPEADALIDPATDKPMGSDNPNRRAVGPNWVYVRIHRNAPGPAQTVRVRFLYSFFGISNIFQYVPRNPLAPAPDDGTGTADFGPTDTKKIARCEWNVPDGMSGHMCLAVEIEAMGDPFLPPSLHHRSPGPGRTDPEVRADNNKAQRNLEVLPMPMGRSMVGADGMALPGGATMSLYARVHNSAPSARDMQIRYDVPPEARGQLRDIRVESVNPQSRVGPGAGDGRFAWALTGILLALVAGLLVWRSGPTVLAVIVALSVLGVVAFLFYVMRGRRGGPAASGDTLTMKRMQPGESRWISFTFDASGLGSRKLSPVTFYEAVGNVPVNGFSIAVRPAPLDDVVAETLISHAAVLSRVDATFGIGGPNEVNVKAAQPHTGGTMSEAEYLQFLNDGAEALDSAAATLFKSRTVKKDIFGVREALKELRTTAKAGNAARAAVAHASLLNKLDALLTTLQTGEDDLAVTLNCKRL